MLPVDYALQNVKGIKESFDNAVSSTIDMYMDLPIVELYNTSETFEIFTSTEGLTGTEQLSDLQTPPTTKLEDGYSVTITEDRFGASITIAERVYRRDGRDSSTKVPQFLERERNLLLEDVRHKLITDIHLFLNDGFTGNVLLGPDGQPLFDASHAWATAGSSTFDNYDTQALDSDAIASLESYAGAFTGPDGKQKPLNFDHIIVKKGSAAANTAKKLFAFQIQPTAIDDINIYYGQYTIIETPYITNPLHWFAYASNARGGNPCKVAIGEAPTLREPQVLENEAIRVNCTGFWKKGIVNVPFAWYGSDGTT